MDQPTFLFYDLETSGLSPKFDRIMQFAAIRTDLNLKQIGEPINFLIKLSDDILPSPGAICVTGITPQQTLTDGLTEAEATRYLSQQIFTPETISLGFNSARFDDQFMRYLWWRNYYDPYTWQYADGRSRWDLLDVVRLVRAIRPEGINWPVDDNNLPVNNLVAIAEANQIVHTKAHDALSDVEALIGVAKLIQQKQPKMWQFLFELRAKAKVQDLVSNNKALVYASGRLGNQNNFTSVVWPLTSDSQKAVVYDLRYNPEDLLKLTPEQIAERIRPSDELTEPQNLIKDLKFNSCPAIAPLGVMDDTTWKQIKLNLETVRKHLNFLVKNPNLISKLIKAGQIIDKAQQDFFDQRDAELPSELTNQAEAKLYQAFVDSASDKRQRDKIPSLPPEKVAEFEPKFNDSRLNDLWLGYKVRNFPKQLSPNEAAAWEARRASQIQNTAPAFLTELEELAKAGDPNQTFCLEELKLWLESIWPEQSE